MYIEYGFGHVNLELCVLISVKHTPDHCIGING